MVGQEAGLDVNGARRATRATLDTLFERLSGGEARDLAERLAMTLLRAQAIRPDRDPEPFRYSEFRRRVADREGVDQLSAERHAIAVLTTLRMAAGDNEFDDMAAQLPADFQPILAEARQPHVSVHSAGDFVSRVADLTGLDAHTAERATDAVRRPPRAPLHACRARDAVWGGPR